MKFLNKYIILVFFALGLSCSLFDPSKKIPHTALGDKAHWTLVSFPLSRVADFRISTNQKFPVRFQDEKRAYALIPRKEWDFYEDKIDFLKTESFDLGFKYFAGNYNRQIEKENFQLSDILAGYKDNRLNEKYLKLIESAYPHLAKMEIVGKSKSKNPILALHLTQFSSQKEVKPSILFNCAMHANEVITTDHCYDVIYTLLNNPTLGSKYLQRFHLWIVPIVNPDGAEAFWNQSHLCGRKNNSEDNLRGVDLNRNFPFHWATSNSAYSSNKTDSPYYQGLTAGSEPEVMSMMALAEKHRFVASISFHAFANSLLFPFSVDGFQNPIPDLAFILAEKISHGIKSLHPEKPFSTKRNLYSVDGVDQDYYYFQYGTLAYIFETSHFNPDYPYVSKILDSFRSVWMKLLDEILESDKILLQVMNEKFEPIKASINIKALTTFNGEQRFNNPENGIFYQYFLPGLAGEILIESIGFQPRTITISPTKSWQPQPVVLKSN